MASVEGVCGHSFVVQFGEIIMTSYSILKTPMGDLMIVANEKELIGLYFTEGEHLPKSHKAWTLDPQHSVLKKAGKELQEYFAGSRTTFTFPSSSYGTDFQRRVWEEIAKIPFGETITYSDLAKRAGRPKAIRAVGTATGRNPLSIMVPCHRVLGKHGAIGGYGGGLARKRQLLKLENVKV
jgi:methylated-DNA-[protein]-cysteine S-methyltransferase